MFDEASKAPMLYKMEPQHLVEAAMNRGAKTAREAAEIVLGRAVPRNEWRTIAAHWERAWALSQPPESWRRVRHKTGKHSTPQAGIPS